MTKNLNKQFMPSNSLIQKWETKLAIPINPKPPVATLFTTKKGIVIATSYQRIVIGRRGPYIEFKREHLYDFEATFEIPPQERYRVKSTVAYYIEHRTTCTEHIMMYEQRRLVSYADYRVGFFYISPQYLYFSKKGKKISPCVYENEPKQLSLWE